MVMRKRRDSLCGAQEPDAVMEFWQQITNKWEAYHTARREAQRAQNLVDTLSAMAKPVRPPVGVDTLTHSPADTARLLSDCTEEQQRLQSRISQYKGRMEALGDRAQLEKQLASVNARLAQLEKTYTALTIAQETLAQARSELQRRFAPRISQRAQTYLSAMTGGRYQRLSMGEDFSLQAGTGDEETLHDALWRSDGTIDQLYLALRLAVAEELTPDSPLILDDALVRFDDTRMQAALAILEELAKNRQVILFTCQQREGNAANVLLFFRKQRRKRGFLRCFRKNSHGLLLRNFSRFSQFCHNFVIFPLTMGVYYVRLSSVRFNSLNFCISRYTQRRYSDWKCPKSLKANTGSA